MKRQLTLNYPFLLKQWTIWIALTYSDLCTNWSIDDPGTGSIMVIVTGVVRASYHPCWICVNSSTLWNMLIKISTRDKTIIKKKLKIKATVERSECLVFAQTLNWDFNLEQRNCSHKSSVSSTHIFQWWGQHLIKVSKNSLSPHCCFSIC